jgi:ATP-binding cassette, subfamily A (ABC1), member 3
MHLWNIIDKLRQLGVTIILTSHSIKECEALCSTVGLLVKGEFKCLQKIENLRIIQKNNYSLVLKVNNYGSFQKIDTFLNHSIRGLVLKSKIFKSQIYFFFNNFL